MTRTLDKTYYDSALISYFIKVGIISWQPSIHNKPEDYGLTIEDSVKIRLKCLRQQAKDLKDEYSAVKGEYLRGTRNFGYLTMNSLQEKINKLERNIHFLKARLRGDTTNQPFDLESLKRVPMNSITEIMPNNFFKVNPFRNEKSPSNSLFWYKAQNRAQDFGTSQSYDSIDLIMAVNSCSFREACKLLLSL